MHKEAVKYRPDIDGLRAVAVLLVIGFHAFPKAFPSGFIGVDIFFVISGFLISSALYAAFVVPSTRGFHVIGNFYGRRIKRIFPSLILVLLVCYLFGLYTLVPGAFTQLSLHVAASAAFCLNFVLANNTGYFDGDSASMPLLHIWSLGVEEQFYLLWPVMIWIAIVCRINLLGMALFIGAYSFFLNEYKALPSIAAAFFLPQMRFWELSVGSIAAALFPPKQTFLDKVTPKMRILVHEGTFKSFPARGNPFADVAAIVGMLLIGVGLFVISIRSDVPDKKCLLPTVGAALVIISGGSAWISRRILSLRPLVGLGLISYPLYLWHWPLLCFLPNILGEAESTTIRIVAIAISILLAYLTYRFLERPMRNGRNDNRKIISLLGVMTLLGTIGFVTYSNRGFPNRFPPIIRELTHFSYDYGKYWREGTYFLDTTQDENGFKNDPDEVRKDKPTILLWGDSHAAALYPGYKASFGADHNIVQRTAVGVAPLLEMDFDLRPNGRRINRFIFESIRRIRPDTVVLAANWPVYNWREVAVTIEALRSVGIQHIVVIGPVPEWVGSLPQQMFNYFERNRFKTLPVRMKTGVNEVPVQIDALMGPFCMRLGVDYISPCEILRNKDGFLVRLGDTADSLMSFDYGHLTKSGSEYLVSHFPKD